MSSIEQRTTTFARPGTIMMLPVPRYSFPKTLRCNSSQQVKSHMAGNRVKGSQRPCLRRFQTCLDRRNTYGCGETVRVIEWTMTATHDGQFLGVPPTHHSVEIHGCSIFVLGEDGFVSEETVYIDAATMLRQLGVLPASANA